MTFKTIREEILCKKDIQSETQKNLEQPRQDNRKNDD